jgi:signal transduction histidine kinase/putative methionine-R-sulfoxide reductase with GAF domain
MAVGASDEIDDLLQLIVGCTAEVLDADRATLYLLQGERLVSRVKLGGDLESISVDLGQGIAGHVAKTGRPLCVKDAYRDPRFDPEWDQKSGYRTRSILAVPVKNHGGEMIGVLQVLNKKGQEGRAQLFTPYDRELLEALAMQAAVSLDKIALVGSLRARNEQLRHTTKRLERTLRDLELLYELETSMSQAESIPKLARSAITLTGTACSAAAGALLHRSGDDLTLYVVNLARPDEVREVMVQQGEGIAARVLERGELIAIGDPGKVRDPMRVRELLGISVRSAIAAPLGGGDQPIVGALALYNHGKAGTRFTPQDVALLKLVSANVVTELRVLESRQQRERAERLGSIGRLLSGVMHDLRTPLTVINGYVQLMLLADDGQVRAEHGAIIAEQFEIIAAMQRDLLAFARGETNVLVRKVYLGRFFEGLATQHQPELSRRGITLDLRIVNNGVAYFDERRMARALSNLVRNAFEAMEQKGGTLTLLCDRHGDDLVMKVIDTGPGIPRAIEKKLFEPFVTKGKKLGTGLGLANVKQIVSEHGGEVDVESSRSGTCFTVTIPHAMRPHSLRIESRQAKRPRKSQARMPRSSSD